MVLSIVPTNNQFRVSMSAESGITYIIESSTNLSQWQPVVTNSDATATRVFLLSGGSNRYYRARRNPIPLLVSAVAAVDTINLTGNIASDSFDSSDTNYSTGGLYDSTKNKDAGDMIAGGTVANTLTLANAAIMGRAKTGPGGTISLGPNGSVGSKAWVQGGNVGVQSGWSATNVSGPWLAVTLPGASWLSAPSGGVVNGTSYSMVFNSSGYYSVSTISGSIYVATNATVVLRVTGTVSLSGGTRIDLSPVGASLRIYMEGASFSTTGSASINNGTGRAGNLLLYGLPTCLTISLSSPSITGAIYAPAASCTFLGGSGNNSYDFVGAIVSKSITVSGNMRFHFDECLKVFGPTR